MASPSLSLAVITVTVASVVMVAAKSCNLSLTFTAKAFFAKPALIFSATSFPETAPSKFITLPSGNLIATIIFILFC